MDIRIDRESAVPLFRQIHNQIRDMILGGTLPEGFRLPPERRLARSLGVNRSTVLTAYRELKADALVDAHVGRGTAVLAVSERPRATARDRMPTEPLAWRPLARSSMAPAQSPLVRDLLELSQRQDVITLSVGLPAADLLPLEAIRRIASAVLGKSTPAALLHSPTEGVTSFRATVADLLVTRGIQVSPGEVLVTSGSQQGLDLVARCFLDPGDLVVVEQPTYFGALQVLRAAQARIVGVPIDRDGMCTDFLAALLERQRPKLIYTLPTFQNPSGAVMSLSRRRHLLELARRHQVPILEDDVYFELRYEGDALPPLKALDTTGHVLYLSSFSKVLFPGLRLGFLAGPQPALQQLVLAKQAMDLHSSTMGQFLLDRFIREGHYARHVKKVRAAYRERRDIMERNLTQAGLHGVSWNRPQGGFYFWCRLPEGLPEPQLLARAAAARVSYLPGSACYIEEPPRHHLRLSFSFPTPEQIREGITRLAAALRRATRESRAPARGAAATPPIV